jgi:hypothetical protein
VRYFINDRRAFRVSKILPGKEKAPSADQTWLFMLDVWEKSLCNVISLWQVEIDNRWREPSLLEPKRKTAANPSLRIPVSSIDYSPNQ